MADPRRGRRWRARGPASSGPLPARRMWRATILDVRLLGLVILLVLTLGAIHFLQGPFPRERPALLLTPFRAGPGGPGEVLLDELTDRVAARVSRLPQLRIVVLARRGEPAPSADLHLTGLALREGEDFRFRITLRRIPEGETRVIGTTRGLETGVEAVAEEIAGIVAEALVDRKP